jgi:serine O-acetyltransferase
MAELARTKGRSYPSRGAALDVLTLPGFWSVALWRLGNLLHRKRLRPLSRLTYVANMVLFGADLPAGASVGPGFVMPHPVGMAMASDVVIGARCHVMGLVRVGGGGKPGQTGHPVIGDDVWLLDGAKVFGPVTIGDRVVVGSSAIVAQDVPDGMFVAGPRGATRMHPRRDLGDGPPVEGAYSDEPVEGA